MRERGRRVVGLLVGKGLNAAAGLMEAGATAFQSLSAPADWLLEAMKTRRKRGEIVMATLMLNAAALSLMVAMGIASVPMFFGGAVAWMSLAVGRAGKAIAGQKVPS